MKTDSKLLTETELELMTVIWTLGQASVHDVQAKLPKSRDLAYTSISTILRILEKKAVLSTHKGGRGHVYVPLITKSEYETKTLRHVVDRVFDGTPLNMVRQLLDSSTISKEEIAELKKLINAHEAKT